MSDLPARSSTEKRRSFLILVAVLVVAAVVVTLVLSRGGDDDAASPSPTSSPSASPGQVTLATACAEIAPDMPNRVDALQRTAEAVRADIATMQAQGNAGDAAQATLVAVALEDMARAQLTQQGVERATRKLGETIARGLLTEGHRQRGVNGAGSAEGRVRRPQRRDANGRRPGPRRGDRDPALAGTAAAADAATSNGPRPNILLIVTDDQRADTLWAMPHGASARSSAAASRSPMRSSRTRSAVPAARAS